MKTISFSKYPFINEKIKIHLWQSKCHRKKAARLRWSDAAMLIYIEDDYLVMLDRDT